METPPVKKVLVLVGEDDLSLLGALRRVLEKAGLRVLGALNGEEGFAAAVKEHPDLILLDIIMPVMDGWTLLKKIRDHDDWGRKVPAIVLTNLSADDDPQIRRIAELGPAYFLIKADWKVESIADKVTEVLKEAPASATPL